MDDDNNGDGAAGNEVDNDGDGAMGGDNDNDDNDDNNNNDNDDIYCSVNCLNDCCFIRSPFNRGGVTIIRPSQSFASQFFWEIWHAERQSE